MKDRQKDRDKECKKVTWSKSVVLVPGTLRERGRERERRREVGKDGGRE